MEEKTNFIIEEITIEEEKEKRIFKNFKIENNIYYSSDKNYCLSFNFKNEGPFRKMNFKIKAKDRFVKKIVLKVKEEKENKFLNKESKVMVLPFDLSLPGGLFKLDKKNLPVDSHICILIVNEKNSIIFGLASLPEDVCIFRIDDNYEFKIILDMNRYIKIEEISIIYGQNNNPFDLIENYGTYLSKFGKKEAEIPIGWNSWDYYSCAITMDDLKKEMKAIKNSALKDKVKYIVIDNGWEEEWGNWIPNRKFPSDLKEIADEIKKYGFIPGIWTAPFLSSIYTTLARYKQELFVPSYIVKLYGPMVIFDLTLPEVHKFLFETFRKMKESGFSFFKIDFLNQPLNIPSCFKDNTKGKIGAIREGIKTIRQAIGEESHLLACGAPLESVIGLADSTRITEDIHNFWGHIKRNAIQISSQYWMNKKLWINDPDFAIIRCNETTDDKHLNRIYVKRKFISENDYWLSGDECNLTELKTYLSLIYLSGGSIFLSDSIYRLNKNGIKILEKIIYPLNNSAIPIDLFYNKPPRIWMNKKEKIIGIFNWEDEIMDFAEISKNMDIPEEGIEFWTGKRTKLKNISLQKHSSILLEI